MAILFPVMIMSCSEPLEQNTETVNQLFFEDFENDLSNWEVSIPEKIRIVESGNDSHGRVLEMHPGGPNVFALMKNSETWEGYVVEGDVLFPEYEHNYLGFIYNYTVGNLRADYGCIYIKGNSSYVRVNPHRDGHVSRILYDEYRTQLTGLDTIEAGKWQHFKAEVIGNACNFYVGNMDVPKVTFPYFEFSSGKVGFEPRVIGSHVWIDNISVGKINAFSYEGQQPQTIKHDDSRFITNWKASGPYRRPVEKIEENTSILSKDPNEKIWQNFECDGRGCVVSGKIIEWTSNRVYAYFLTEINVNEPTNKILNLSTTNDLVVFVNGKKAGEVEGTFKAWYDFLDNPRHAGQQLNIQLQKGLNKIIIRDKGMGFDGYAGDGFYAALLDTEE